MKIKQFLFTHCASGAGYDPEKSSGYQIKAMSGEVGSLAILAEWSAQLGQTVYSYSPESARKREGGWQSTTESVADGVPREILDLFPVIWTYRRLEGGSYTLMRTSYIGLTRDRRSAPGNFLVNALVFSPGRLAPSFGNPLGLLGSDHYQVDPDSISPGPLPAFDDFGAGVSNECDISILREPPYDSILPSLVSAAIESRNRPLLICIGDSRRATELLGALLQALPPRMRRETTFTSHTHDACWPGTNPTEADPLREPNQITVIGDVGPDSRGLQPGEARIKHLRVFNFVSGLCSDPNEVSALGEFSARCIGSGGMEELERFHRDSATIGCDHSPSDCERLLLFSTLRSEAPSSRLGQALEILLPLARGPKGVEGVFALVENDLTAFSRSPFDPRDEQIGRLVGQLWKDDTSLAGNQAPPSLERMMELVKERLAEGTVRKASILLNSCGAWGSHALHQVFDSLCGASATVDAANAPEAEHLFLSLFSILSENPSGRTGETLFLSLLRLSSRTDAALSQKFWSSLQPFVEGLMKDRIPSERHRFVSDSCLMCNPVRMPDASLYFNRLFLEQFQTDEGDLRERIGRMATACAHCSDPIAESTFLEDLIMARFTGVDESPLMLGSVAEMAFGSVAGDCFLKTLGDALKQMGGGIPAFEEKLAEHKCWRVLAWRFLENVGNCSKQEALGKVEFWIDREVFQGNQVDMADLLCDVLALTATEPDPKLARTLLERQRERNPAGKGFSKLLGRVSSGFPVGGFPSDWDGILKPAPEDFSKVVQRFEISKFLSEIEARAVSGEWSFSDYDQDASHWESLGTLESSTRDEVFGFLMSLLKIAGLFQGRDARAFVNVLSKLYRWTPEKLAVHLSAHLRDCDIVTQVTAASAIYQCSVIESSTGDLCIRSLEILISELGQANTEFRHLLSIHLKQRFSDPRFGDLPGLADLLESIDAGVPRQSGGSTAQEGREKGRSFRKFLGKS